MANTPAESVLGYKLRDHAVQLEAARRLRQELEWAIAEVEAEIEELTSQ